LTAASFGIFAGAFQGFRKGGGTFKLRTNSILNEIGKRTIKWGNASAVARKISSFLTIFKLYCTKELNLESIMSEKLNMIH
jgi:hypothetical protein